MRALRTFLIVFLSAFTIPSLLLGEDIVFMNGTKQLMKIWLKPNGATTYFHPTTLAPLDEKAVPFDDKFQGERWMAISGSGNRFEHVGWIDLLNTPIATTNNKRTLLVDRVSETRTKEESYTVYKQVFETRVDASGREYKVSKFVPEQRTITRSYNVVVPRVRAYVNNEWVPVEIKQTLAQ